MDTQNTSLSIVLKLFLLVLLGFLLNNATLTFVQQYFTISNLSTNFYMTAIGSQVFVFLLPSIIWLRWAKKKVLQPFKFNPKIIKNSMLVVCGFVLVYGLNAVLSGLITQFGSLDWIKAIQVKQAELFQAIFNRNQALFPAIIVVAALPAFVEELFFRRIIFAYFYEQSGRFWRNAILSATIFALVHFQPILFPAIFIIGLLFAYLYKVSGSIWLGVVLHFLNNGFQIVQIHYGIEISGFALLIACIIATITAFFLIFLIRTKKNQQ